ncbi:hypothetical protein BKA93DRAFT_827995 [Sparassis latifolia]|uniref:Uncharacterized protein n=1 Tax=Sparassis crispa TaxID=139825 RepID=A0A401GI91_9APHY|nr:hypothetical protein SCP_0402040 [Sparassis crispa]GBE81831.1 hypothetical protein SCP_0402040 [Sparassis crispa]
MRRSESRFPSFSLSSSKTRQLPLYSASSFIRQSLSSPSDHQLPSYGAVNSTRRAGYLKRHPPPYEDLMKTVDYRHTEEPPRYRSSFALSDIFEDDEIEIEISSILPSSTPRAESVHGRAHPPRLCAFMRNILSWLKIRCLRKRLLAPTPDAASIMMHGVD